MNDKILILNDTRDAGWPYRPFFDDMGKVTEDVAEFHHSPRDFKLVLFTGGSDVSPGLYKDTSPNNLCHCNLGRDNQEEQVFNTALAYKIAMFGICRGFQFINVMCGGSLIHHLNGHSCGSHQVVTGASEQMLVNSLHHQMCIPPISAELLAWSSVKLSKTYFGSADREFDYQGPEVEAAYYPEHKAVGVQWHPEALKDSERSRAWSRNLVRDTMNLGEVGFRKLYYPSRPKVEAYES